MAESYDGEVSLINFLLFTYFSKTKTDLHPTTHPYPYLFLCPSFPFLSLFIAGQGQPFVPGDLQ